MFKAANHMDEYTHAATVRQLPDRHYAFTDLAARSRLIADLDLIARRSRPRCFHCAMNRVRRLTSRLSPGVRSTVELHLGRVLDDQADAVEAGR